jgi:hypothetical protein
MNRRKNENDQRQPVFNILSGNVIKLGDDGKVIIWIIILLIFSLIKG